MAKYVKFLRGTPEAYARLPHKDSDTLYFIYEEDESTGILYLGSKVIAGGDDDQSSSISTLSDLKDVLLSELSSDALLVYDHRAAAWVNKALEELIFVGATTNSSGQAGLVPAPGLGETDLFLRSDGSWATVDLSSYITREENQELLDAKVDKVEDARLITKAESEKLATLQPIKSVSKEFVVTEDGQLSFLSVSINQVENLANILNKGQVTDGGYSLISPEEKAKIEALVINPEDGSLEISGYVNAERVQGLAEWITDHSTGENFVPGLSQHSLTDERLAKLDKAITSEFINSVGPEFKVVNGQLNFESIVITQVTDLTSILNQKVETSEFVLLSTEVDEHDSKIKELRERLTWEELTEI